MYDGNNRLAIRSQRWLVSSLCELMEEIPYEKITIGQICGRADLSRQTFYNLFGSKDEILRFGLRDAYEECFRGLADKETLAADDVVESFLDVVENTQALLDAIIKNDLGGILSEEISRCVGMFAGRFVPTDEKDEMLPYMEALTAGALSGMLTFHLTKGEPADGEKLSGLLSDFLGGTFYGGLDLH